MICNYRHTRDDCNWKATEKLLKIDFVHWIFHALSWSNAIPNHEYATIMNFWIRCAKEKEKFVNEKSANCVRKIIWRGIESKSNQYLWMQWTDRLCSNSLARSSTKVKKNEQNKSSYRVVQSRTTFDTIVRVCEYKLINHCWCSFDWMQQCLIDAFKIQSNVQRNRYVLYRHDTKYHYQFHF